MRTHTQEFKSGLIELGREVSAIIDYNDVTLSNEQLYSITPNFETELLKSVMTGLEIVSAVDIPVGTKFNFRWGIKVGNEYEYLDYGSYKVFSSEIQEDKKTYSIIAYDGMLESMKEYEGLSIDFPCTIQTFLGGIANKLGWTYTPTQFTNYDKLIQDLWCEIDDEGQKKSMGYTYRDVLDEVAEATATNIVVKNDNLMLITPNETNDVLQDDFIKTTTAEFSTYGPINAVVFSRSSSDNIYAKDNDSIEENGLCEFKISDNQILNSNNRDEYIEGVYNALHNLVLTTCEFSTCGIGYYEPLDKFSIRIGENTYNNIIMLNSNLKISDGIVEDIYVKEPSESETDYTKADATDRRLNQTTLIVDKQNQQIQGVITDVQDNNERVTQLTLDVQGLKSDVENLTFLGVTQQGYGSVQFEKINQGQPIRIKVHAMADSDIAFIYPSNNLFPSNDFFMKNRILRFTNTETDEVWEYTIPDNLRYYNATTYDEFLLDYETDTCQVTKKVGINADRSKYALVTEQVIDYTYPTINLSDGDYIVELLGYPNAFLEVTLMKQNTLTKEFATKVEMNSSITQKANEITTEVSTNYMTKGEGRQLDSKITQTAEEINTEVRKKVGNDEVISKINQSAEAVKILANKLGLTANDVINLIAGNSINLTSKNITINSNNFNVDANGNVIANSFSSNNANITGGRVVLTPGDGNLNDFQILGNSYELMASPTSLILHSKYLEWGISMDLTETNVPLIQVYDGTNNSFIEPSAITTPQVIQTSLKKDKKNFELFKNGLEKILKTDIYKYNLKSEKDGSKKHIGFVIGNEYNYANEITAVDKENKEIGVDPYSMISVAYKAIQEQQEQIEFLKNKIKEMEGNANGKN